MDVLHLFAQMPGQPAYRPLPSEPCADPGPMGFVELRRRPGRDRPRRATASAFDNETAAAPGLARALPAGGQAGDERRVAAPSWTTAATQSRSSGSPTAGRWSRRRAGLSRSTGSGGRRRRLVRDEPGGLASPRPACAGQPLSYYEADAYARWAGKRLPTEAEWEHAAAGLDERERRARPRSSGAAPGRRGRAGLEQMFGALWQWTSSAYLPIRALRRTPARSASTTASS